MIEHERKMNPILKTLIIVWVIFCTLFMAYSGWVWAVASKLQAAAAEGRDQMLESIIAAAKTCKPVDLHGKNEQIKIANLGCLAANEEKK